MPGSVARVATGATPERLAAELRSIDGELLQAAPLPLLKTVEGARLSVEPLKAALTARTRGPLGILMASVTLLLLIACANIATLQVARAMSRQEEIAIRLSLGATWWRVCRERATESVVLGVLGGLLALLVANWSARLLPNLLDPSVFGLAPLSLHWPVIALGVGTALVTSIAFGVAPLLLFRGFNLGRNQAASVARIGLP